ncbi:hypothetical protein H6P81_001297 [Aristolochia fimbriata]|uniref:RRM domain-containing protein n=1 Tax=Aristolochia fimbriata TaxID=158543 RepID=A0AAV7F848_ARIFI|nr:hypothetical protein H6P81_001297 [Aristolochia fimbriata]
MAGGRKRDRSYFSSSRLKRPRRSPPLPESDIATADAAAAAAAAKESVSVIVTGLPPECQVLEVKSRFQMYGPVSRLHIDRQLGYGYVTFRSPDAADAAIAASGDPDSGISIGPVKVRVYQPSSPLPGWSARVQNTGGEGHQPSSKLLRAEVPLSKHGKAYKRLVGVNEISEKKPVDEPAEPFKGREIIAYDDIL